MAEIKRWTGSAWEVASLKYWNGSAWEEVGGGLDYEIQNISSDSLYTGAGTTIREVNLNTLSTIRSGSVSLTGGYTRGVGGMKNRLFLSGHVTSGNDVYELNISNFASIRGISGEYIFTGIEGTKDRLFAGSQLSAYKQNYELNPETLAIVWKDSNYYAGMGIGGTLDRLFSAGGDTIRELNPITLGEISYNPTSTDTLYGLGATVNRLYASAASQGKVYEINLSTFSVLSTYSVSSVEGIGGVKGVRKIKINTDVGSDFTDVNYLGIDYQR